MVAAVELEVVLVVFVVMMFGKVAGEGVRVQLMMEVLVVVVVVLVLMVLTCVANAKTQGRIHQAPGLKWKL